MKNKKKLLLTLIAISMILLSGCSRKVETIDVNYWQAKLKRPTSKNALETLQDTAQNLADKSADATEDLYLLVGDTDLTQQSDFLTKLAQSIGGQIRQWGQEGLENAPGSVNTNTTQTEVPASKTSIVADASACANSRIQVSLDRVVDGDTIIVEYKQQLLRVRLIGINTPESVHTDENKNTPEGVAASNYLKEYLKETSHVWLEFDEDTEDEYGRTLAYVWLSQDGTDPELDLLNGVILKSGHAEVMFIEPNTKYANALEQLVSGRP